MGLTLAYNGLFFDCELELFKKYNYLAFHGKNRRIRKKNMKKANEIAALPRFRRYIKKLIQCGEYYEFCFDDAIDQ